MIEAIDVVFIHSQKGEELASWYARVLGLPQNVIAPEWRELKLKEGARFAVDCTSFPRSTIEKQPIVISFKVRDIKEAVKTLETRGVTFYEGDSGKIMDVGPTLVATFCDPDGNWLQLSQQKG